MKKIYFLLFFSTISMLAKSQQIDAPFRLRCDLLLQTNKVTKNGLDVNIPLESAVLKRDSLQFPIIYNQQPLLNWEIAPSIHFCKAYRVVVASSIKLLNSNKPDFWDSKRIPSTQNHTRYQGASLIPGKIYYWKVQTWNEKNIPSQFSAYQSFYYSAQDATNEFSRYPLTASFQFPVSTINKGDGRYFFDFGKDAFAQLTFQLTSNETNTIWIEAGEACTNQHSVDSNPGQNIRYTKIPLLLKKGTHNYTIEWPANEKRNSRNPIKMPHYIGEVYPFRYVSISNFNGILLPKAVQRKVVFYPFDEQASSFTSSDTVLNQVWDLCKYSIKATSFTGCYVDGDRERVPYEADALINQLSHYGVDAEYSMARRSMVYLIFNPTWPTEWSLQNVPIAWYDYWYTGDDSFLKKYYTELQKKMLLALVEDNGLISTKTNKQTPEFLQSIHILKAFDGKSDLKDIVDWPQPQNGYIGNEKQYPGETDGFVFSTYNSVVNAWYYQNLVLMQKIALLLNKPTDANYYGQLSTKVYQSYQQVFVDKKSGLIKDGDTTNHNSLHSNMFALAFGLVPQSNLDAVISFIKSRKMACSVYGAQFLLDALYANGQGDYALQLLTSTAQRSWYNMIRVGSTISMEAWDKLYKPNLDLNHAWGAAPANLIVRKLMGVEPLSAGGDTIQIKPQFGNLQFAKLKTTILSGALTIAYNKSNLSEIMEIHLPGNTVTTVYMPFNPSKPHLQIDGKDSKIEPINGYFMIKNIGAGNHLMKTN